MPQRIGATITCALLAACSGRPPFVVLTVEDAGSVAAGFTALRVGLTPDELEAVSITKTTFPLSITVTAKGAGNHELWVEARTTEGVALGRGTTAARFARTGTPTATVRLVKACEADIDCSDGLFCTGSETCGDRMCAPGTNPCAANVECATSTCVEGTGGQGACDTEVDNSRCPLGTYCNPLRGCIEGQGCVQDLECQDGSVCNGTERCVNLVCTSGPLPVLDDGDICTVDGCNDDRASQELDPVFHVALASLDGSDCTIPGTGVPGAAGVCVSSKGGCRVSECWDGVVSSQEDCDDGNLNPADGCDACVSTVWQAEAIVGEDALASAVGLAVPSSVAVDMLGNIYVTDYTHRVRKIAAPTGVVSTVAGTGIAGPSGDGGAATYAQLCFPNGVAVDGLGNVYVGDSQNHRVRKVSAATGIIETVAGTGTPGFSGDGGPAANAQLQLPNGIAVDGLGRLYIADYGNHRIREVAEDTGIIRTVAGTGTAGYSGDGIAATSAKLSYPTGVAVDGVGNVYVADMFNQRVRKIVAGSQLIETVAGTGTAGYSGDGVAATTAQLNRPYGVVLDRFGNIYVADSDNDRVRKITVATGMIETIAGTGLDGFSGDGELATSGQVWRPLAVAVDLTGNLYVADSGNLRIREVAAATGIIATVAGSGAGNDTGDGGAATSAALNWPLGVAVDAGGSVYIADGESFRVRRVAAGAAVIETVAGTGGFGNSGDGGPATSARFRSLRGIGLDSLGDLYIVDTGNRVIRKVVATTGVVETIAGTGTAGYSGDGGLATAAQLASPFGLAVDGLGNAFVADTGNHCVRKIVAATGFIETLAGTGVEGFSGDDDAATSAQLASPYGVALDGVGNVYVADTGNNRVRVIAAATGVISTVAGIGTSGFSGDGSAATNAELCQPYGVAVDGLGNVYIADTYNFRIREVAAGVGTIETVAGTGDLGLSGDGGSAMSASLDIPFGIAVDGLGNLYVAEGILNSVRKVAAGTGIITTIAGQIDPEGMGPVVQARLSDPRAIVWTGDAWLFANGSSGTVQMLRSAGGWLGVVAGRYRGGGAVTGNLARFRTDLFGTVGGVTYDSTGTRIYVSESSGNRLHVVTVVDPNNEKTWTIADLAGDAALGAKGFADGPAATARFRNPTGLFLDKAVGVLYIADTGNHVIRALTLSSGEVSTVAGTPATLGLYGDNGPATMALLDEPAAVTGCGGGDLFVADTGNNRVRRIHRIGSDDIISTVLGDGTATSSGEGSPAWTFPVETPRGVACDAFGNLYVTSTDTVRLLPATDAGVVDGAGSVQTIYGNPTVDTFPANISECLTGLATAGTEKVWVSDSCAGMLVELRRQPAL